MQKIPEVRYDAVAQHEIAQHARSAGRDSGISSGLLRSLTRVFIQFKRRRLGAVQDHEIFREYLNRARGDVRVHLLRVALFDFARNREDEFRTQFLDELALAFRQLGRNENNLGNSARSRRSMNVILPMSRRVFTQPFRRTVLPTEATVSRIMLLFINKTIDY